jgi:uncharacterized protein YgiM (DUF1202 family)
MSNLNKLAFAALLLCGAAGEASAQSREFFCSNKSSVTIKVIDARTVSVGPIKGKTVALEQNPQSPMSFVSAKVAVAIAKDEKSITLRQSGAPDMKCVFPKPAGQKPVADDDDAAASSEPKPKSGAKKFQSFAAKSWGGVVRSGPGMEFKKVASLQEGDPITAIEQSTEMNGYFWYKIRFGKNKTGYQWGGIICPVGKLVPGTFEQCD